MNYGCFLDLFAFEDYTYWSFQLCRKNQNKPKSMDVIYFFFGQPCKHNNNLLYNMYFEAMHPWHEPCNYHRKWNLKRHWYYFKNTATHKHLLWFISAINSHLSCACGFKHIKKKQSYIRNAHLKSVNLMLLMLPFCWFFDQIPIIVVSQDIKWIDWPNLEKLQNLVN